MQESFNMREWVRKVQEQKPHMDALARLLSNYGAEASPDEESHDVASLHYSVRFSFPGNVVVTIGIILMDRQTDSNVVIETMTTLPQESRSKGFGSKALQYLLQWAHDNQLLQVRATQINNPDSERFWKRNAFVQAPSPNQCNDFVWHRH